MPTGLTIRDFTKQYRELRFSNQGSIRLSEIEHNAYLNRLTIEITHYDAYRSVSFKSLPDSTHWGYLTTFKGSSVIDKMAVKFAKQRVYEHINSDIWDYHQASESLTLIKTVNEAGINALISGGVLGEATDAIVKLFVKAKEGLPDPIDNLLYWLVGSRPFTAEDPAEIDYSYTAFPISSPYPDVFKFLSDIPCSFLFRLESWYLVNPVVYALSNPTDTSDETEDETEYPFPETGDGSGQGTEFPPSDLPADGSDPRDFEDDDQLPGTGEWSFVVSFSDPGNNAACDAVPPQTLALRGFPDEPIQREFTGEPTSTGGRPGRFFTSVASVSHSGDCQLNGPGSPIFTPDA